MTDAARQAALSVALAEMRRLRNRRDLSHRVAAASVLLLRGPLREIDDKLCRIEPGVLARLADAEAGLAGVN